MDSPKVSRAIALGFFDGVHIGHGVLLRRTAEAAARNGARPCALTFDSHPEARILDHAIPLLCTIEDRADLIRRLYGMEEVIFAHFDDALMHMPWRDFLQELLINRFHAAHVVAGYDFHFGYRGEGNAALLSDACAQAGVGCDIIPRVELSGITVSSTYIRKLVAQGDIERARLFLGHPHALSGFVGHGRKLASSWNVPTINFPLPAGIQSPAKGVYASTASWGDNCLYPAVTNIGTRPTVSCGADIMVETHILGFEGDLYGRRIRLELHKFLRPESRFHTYEELARQIELDIREARAFHQLADEI
ncbi:MAG: riboflavin biosynthesis protein RibF [Oscillospiraceae bacterium]|jgi:riboflavin kinase/FMN adenylyltransferase|nr:riboflavin biosynthesis protein RibF [Oscillospiraceae bacterium]